MTAFLNRIASAGVPLHYNREGMIGQDGWIHIVPKGELPNAEAGVVQVLDDASLDSIVANFKADALRLGNRWPGLYMGQEHFIYDGDKSSEAFYWAKEFEKRGDGIWAKGDATDIGETAIKNKRFKFTSFVTDPRVPGSLEKLDGDRVRVLRVDTVGFTNYANGRHLLTPLTNRDLPDDPADRTAADLADTKKRKTMKSIATRLGLSADASEEAILGELTKLENRATSAEGKLKPLEDENKTLKNRVEKIEDDQAEADLDHAGIKTDDPERPKIKEVLLKNREGGLLLLKRLGKETPKGKTPMTNRAEAKTPNKGQQADGETEKKAEEKRAVLIRNRADGKMRENKALSISSAFHQATLEVDQEIEAGITK